MADVTGRSYEAFGEFLLRQLGYRDQWTDGSGRQYLYEKHQEALCHVDKSICLHSVECHAFSERERLPYGPWYSPDFFVLDGGHPVACLHVTHWSNPRDSHRKFWRTVEDHFEYKSQFGRDFLSINLVFVALDPDQQPRRVVDSQELIPLHGWSPANGSMLAVSFDSSILFPQEYLPIEEFASALPEAVPGSARKRRQVYNSVWEALYKKSKSVRKGVDRAARLLKTALASGPSPRYTPAAITKLQDVCWEGRKRSVALHPTETRYRKGLQQAFIIRELVARMFGSRVDPDAALWSILTSNPRFSWKALRGILGATKSVDDAEIDALRNQLASVPVQMVKRKPVYLLSGAAGLEHAEWNPDLKQFILGLRYVKSEDLASLRRAVEDLFTSYRTAYSMHWVLADLADPERIRRKVEYVGSRFVGLTDKATFITRLTEDLLDPGRRPAHQSVVEDMHNWPPDVLFAFYDLGSMQHITTALPAKFAAVFGHSLRPYAYMNNLGALTSHLIAGVPVGQFFSNGTELAESDFYEAIWPLFAECVWEAIGKRKALDPVVVEVNYRYKKAMRIIAAPDLEPISFLLLRSLPSLKKGPTLRGAFNGLSVKRGWSRAALTTETTGQDGMTGAIIQTQAVIGAKNIDHKVKELASRLRSVHLRCQVDSCFGAESNPGQHFLVVDGDWPVDSKINLLEAGYSGIFEIAELDALTDALEPLKGAKGVSK